MDQSTILQRQICLYPTRNKRKFEYVFMLRPLDLLTTRSPRGFLPYGPGNNQGAFAEFLIARSDQIALKPPTVSHHQAAAAATAALTSIQAIRDPGKLSSSNT